MTQVLILLKPIIALLLLLFFMGLYIKAKNKSNYDLGRIQKYQFKLPFLAPVGFFITEKIPCRFDSAYDRKIRSRIGQLYGRREASVFFQVHIAQKLVLSLVVLFIFTLITLLGDVQPGFILFGLAITVLVYFWIDKEIEKKLDIQKRDMLIDLPRIINTLTLLINAGLPFSSAVKKVVEDDNTNRPLYKEFSYLMAEIDAGKPIGQAYEDLAQRCKVPEITRFVSTILQNLNRGSSDLVHVLTILSQQAWDKRKDIAKRQGEEASSKMVFPMVMVFVAVTIIVLAPAIMAMGS